MTRPSTHRGGLAWVVATVTAILLLSCGQQPKYDLLIAGGTVIDGTGAPRVTVDVAIHDGLIAKVAPSIPEAMAKKVVDATGLIVAPGFWDNHAHIVELEERPAAENFVRQGITTIMGSLHSQDQVADIASYRERVRPVPNIGLYAGHTWIRKQVLGLANRPPTAQELEAMQDLVDQAMQDGALGLATGLEYVPAAFAKPDEIVALAKVAAEYGGHYVSHMRDEGVRLMESIEEVLEVGRQAKLPVHINHLKVTGSAHFGQSEQMLERLDAAIAEGLLVAFDVYPYTAFSTYSDLMFPAWALADGDDAFTARVADSKQRKRLVDEMEVIFTQQTGPGPESILFREVSDRPDLSGQTLAAYIESQGKTANITNAVEALIDLQLNGGFIGTFFGMSEEDVGRFVTHPRAMFETDGDLVEPGQGFPHPRSYGSFPRILSRYVRDQKLLSLEQAIHKMTALPAEWYGQPDRGRILGGQIADLTVFDAAEIQDRSEYLDPHHYSVGIKAVFIRGTAVLEDEEMTGERPGSFLDRPN